MVHPVSAKRIAIAGLRLQNVDIAAVACREVGLPFWAACALLEMESGGRNVFGHDVGGALSGYPEPVDASNFAVFHWFVVDKGQTSNGIGPCQITYAGALKNGKRDGGYFREMAAKGLKPWVPHDNMVFGFGIMMDHFDHSASWEAAGTAYNGKASYGRDYLQKCNEWRQRLGVKGSVK